MKMAEKETTIQDVARLAGLSKAAVSRYLNNKITLPAQTVERIEGAIQALGFRRNLLAQRLSTGRSETIGLVVPEISNPFYAEMAEGAEDEAAKAGYSLILGIGRNDVDREIEFLRWLDTHMVDGLLFASNRPDDGLLRDQMNRYRPVILLDEDIPGADITKIFCDNRQGALAAVRHLTDHGHRHIAHVTGPAPLMTVEERLGGYRTALMEADIPFRAELVFHGDFSREFGRQAVARILDSTPRPHAIFAASDYIAIGLLEGLRDAGIRVPEDMSIVGFDDISSADLVTPRLTTIRQDAEAMGRQGVLQLLATINDPGMVVQQTRIPVTLTVRDSVILRA
jgi:LacI family transcriptional regulator